MLKTQVEIGKDISFDHSVRLFQSAYQNHANEFTSEFFKWRYTQCFGDKTILVSLLNGSHRIGQAVIFCHTYSDTVRSKKVCQLGDLIVHHDHRSIAAVRAIYRKLTEIIKGENFDFVFTLPNQKSEKFNQRFLNMRTENLLEARLSIGWPRKSRQIVSSAMIDRVSNLEELFADYMPMRTPKVGLFWDISQLKNRLQDPRRDYAIIATAHSVMVTMAHRLQGVPLVLVMGVISANNHQVKRSEWNAMINASSRLFRNPVHLYMGWNCAFDNKFGWQLPSIFDGSVKPLQTLKLGRGNADLVFPRFELLDVDIY